MGTHRNGARSFLDAVAEACRFSHMRGFRAALTLILGGDTAADLYALWTPFCTFVENLISIDNWWNQKDTEEQTTGGEDVAPGV